MKPYYDQDGIRIYHGDCRDALPIACDSVVTDPPYGVGLTGKLARTRNTAGDGVFRPGHYAFEDSAGYVAAVVVPVINQCRSFAKVVVVTPGTRNLWLYPPADDVGCFYSASGTGRGRWGFTCSQPILFYGPDPYLAACMGARPNSLGQTYPNDANKVGHPCAKPLPMWRWLVARASLQGGTILDPFMGSGTTLVAAKQLGNKAIGIEIEERYCEIAATRLSQGALPMEFSAAAPRSTIPP